MSGGAGTSLGPGLPVSQLRLRHLTYGRAGQTARTRMPHARGVAPARRDPPETRRCCASKDENGRVPRTAVGDVAVGNLYAATTVSVRISTPAGTTPASTERQSAMSSLRAKAPIAIRRVRPAQVPTRVRNPSATPLPGWERSQSHARRITGV